MERKANEVPVRRFGQALRYSIAGMSGISLWTGLTAPEQIRTLAGWLPLVNSTWVRIILFIIGFGGFLWLASRPLELKGYKVVGNKLVRDETNVDSENIPTEVPTSSSESGYETEYSEAKAFLNSDPLKGLRDGIGQLYRSWGSVAVEAARADVAGLVMGLNYETAEYAWAAQELLGYTDEALTHAEANLRKIFTPYEQIDPEMMLNSFPIDAAKFFRAQTSPRLVTAFFDYFSAYRDLTNAMTKVSSQLQPEAGLDRWRERDRQFTDRVRDLGGRIEFNDIRTALEEAIGDSR